MKALEREEPVDRMIYLLGSTGGGYAITKFSSNDETDHATWYNMWEAINAIYYLCAIKGRPGSADTLGISKVSLLSDRGLLILSLQEYEDISEPNC